MFAWQDEREANDHSEETSRREQLIAQSHGRSRHRKPWRIKTGRAKDPRLHRAKISVERIQHPGLAQQLGKLDPAAASQWIVRASDHDQGIMEENFFRKLLADGTRKSCNHEIHMARRQLLAQRRRHAGDDMKRDPRIFP